MVVLAARGKESNDAQPLAPPSPGGVHRRFARGNEARSPPRRRRFVRPARERLASGRGARNSGPVTQWGALKRRVSEDQKSAICGRGIGANGFPWLAGAATA